MRRIIEQSGLIDGAGRRLMRLYLSSFRLGNQPGALLHLLGGRTRTALILNADDYKTPAHRDASRERELTELRSLELDPTEIDLRQYFGRESELRPLLTGFDLVYVRGGNVFILRRALRQSGADRILTDLLGKDAIVYAGYSAGPCMLGPTLHGIQGDEDDPGMVPDGYDRAVIWDGLGLLPFALAPHYCLEPGVAGATPTVDYYIDHHIPFVALRDGQALVVDGDRTTVVG
jgi:dipeptidase E